LGLIGWGLGIKVEWHVVLRGRWRDGRVRDIVDGGRDGLQVDKAGSCFADRPEVFVSGPGLNSSLELILFAA
jgi:hypothetical protein